MLFTRRFRFTFRFFMLLLHQRIREARLSRSTLLI